MLPFFPFSLPGKGLPPAKLYGLEAFDHVPTAGGRAGEAGEEAALGGEEAALGGHTLELAAPASDPRGPDEFRVCGRTQSDLGGGAGGNGRVEARRVWVTDAERSLGDEFAGLWPGLAGRVVAVVVNRSHQNLGQFRTPSADRSADHAPTTPRPRPDPDKGRATLQHHERITGLGGRDVGRVVTVPGPPGG